ncbi:hypothetical protein GCM10010172_42440 [Paractinoplanes ferrugineus]|uniref:DUF308 domain-containing protein n=1 Tax=Paractinoplanes ferrugineus TaxID=113564 RepID=A0A919J4V7_9ACTN|nr:hypothetical protein [Actinoplanes ferrugineus]GIE13402.1 hypothetical protein Afe05nite_52420 [Actinoplanes ferrugineus]
MIEQTTTVPTPSWARVLTWLGLPLAGGAMILMFLRVASWLPLPLPFGILRRLPEPAAGWIAISIGMALGLALASLVHREALTVQINPAEVVLSRPGVVNRVPLGQVAVAFHEHDQLILLGRTGRELAREPSYLSVRRIREAFLERGVAWTESDPYSSAYRRWVPGLPEIAATANALFEARQAALRSGDEGDGRELRAELARLGYVIRDEGKRQYWRYADG